VSARRQAPRHVAWLLALLAGGLDAHAVLPPVD